jgi:phage FluMu gp28-like protein
MSAIFPAISIDKNSLLSEYFLPYQLSWIYAEDEFHAQKKQVFALAEKSVRIGWTYADAFKNVRKRLRFNNRDYLFATKDYPSALEYMRVAREFVDLYGFTRAIVSHGEDYLKLPSAGSTRAGGALSPRAGSTTEEIKIGYIKFDNGSRIIAFSAHPQAMAVYGGDVGLDEFAKHPNAELLWQTAQGRVTWAYDLAVWSSHEGDDTLFNQFAQQARLQCSVGVIPSPRGEGQGEGDRSARQPNAQREKRRDTQSSESESRNTQHAIRNTTSSPWNLYFKVTIADAIESGLLNVINRTRDANLTPVQFLADCRARAGLEQIFQQSYMCNPVPGGASIVDWAAIDRCRSDYEIERVHLEATDVTKLFGDFNPSTQESRQSKIEDYLREHFSSLLNRNRNPNLNPSSHASHSSHHSHSSSTPHTRPSSPSFRLGFDIAASGQGDLCAIYIDEARADDLWLRALITCRTEDWDFIKTVLFFFLENLSRVKAAGDESGLGRQICWEAAQQFSYKFTKVNFAAKKQDLGFALMNQLSVAEKHIPKDHPDIAADLFALRKSFIGNKWVFTEGRNHSNSASHCDIAWAAALATFAHNENETVGVSAAVAHETGWFDGREFHRYNS